jgi:hypothetical protein
MLAGSGVLPLVALKRPDVACPLAAAAGEVKLAMVGTAQKAVTPAAPMRTVRRDGRTVVVDAAASMSLVTPASPSQRSTRRRNRGHATTR